ncbi:MAG: TolB family protein [Acidimicrobiia bacterium]
MTGRATGTILVCVGFALAACTTADGGEPTTTPIEDTFPGRIVVLDGGGDIVTMDPDGSGRVAVTDDGDSVTHFQPVWSPDSPTVAWSVADEAGFALMTASGDGADLSRIDVSGFPFYINWSPDGEQIGILHAGTGGALDFVLVDPEAGRATQLDSGSPYYFSWSPGSDAVVGHVDGVRLAIFDESATPTDIGPASPRFFAPRWVPSGIFYLGPEGVTLRNNDGTSMVFPAPPSGQVSINPNPQGSLVAVHSLGGSGGMTVGLGTLAVDEPRSVAILDIESGISEVVSTTLSVGSFWSPDGARLLILEVNADERVVDVVVWEASETRLLTTIEIPGSLITEALAFFDQYAQSWRMWSPGSDAIVLPGATEEGDGIWVIPVDGSDPANISDGDWAAWSYGT